MAIQTCGGRVRGVTERRVARKTGFVHEAVIPNASDATQLAFLHAAYSKIGDLFGLKPPSMEEVVHGEIAGMAPPAPPRPGRIRVTPAGRGPQESRVGAPLGSAASLVAIPPRSAPASSTPSLNRRLLAAPPLLSATSS